MIAQLKKQARLPTEKVYSAHRARQRNRILDAAAKLFAERGLEPVTMGELTVASGVQPSTMYQYFPSKDEIIWAIVGTILTRASSDPRQADVRGRTGLRKIADFLDYMADELSNEAAQVRFMAQFDAMYAMKWPVERLLLLEADAGNFRPGVLRALIEEGMADGSLRSDLDPELTLEAVINAAIGTQRRLATLDKKLEVEYGKPADRLFREAIRILLFGLQAANPGQKVVSLKRAKTKRVNSKPRRT